MKKIFKRKTPVIEQYGQPDITNILDRMQQQLISLEKKVDTLINQPKDSGRPFQRFNNSFRKERSFTKATCADCHTECEVPFKPTGDRPVYCKDCFEKRRGTEGGGPVRDRHFDKPQHRENRRPGGRNKPLFRKRRERS